MPETIPFDPIQIWGAFGAVIILLFLALVALLREWVVLGNHYRALQERLEESETNLEEARAELIAERDKRETILGAKDDQMHKLRDSLEDKLNESNRLLIEATEAFQRMRRSSR